MPNTVDMAGLLTRLVGEAKLEHLLSNYYYKKNTSGDRMRHMHSHGALEIEYVVEGEVLIHFNNNVVRLVKGDSIVIQPNVTHMFSLGEKCCQRANIQLNAKYLDGFDLGFAGNRDLSAGYVKLTNNPMLGEIMRTITGEMAARRWECEVMIKAQIICLLINLSREIRAIRRTEDSKSRYVEQVMALIKESLFETPNPQQFARALHISTSYLMHIFKSETGMPLMKYITARKMEICMKRLVDTDDSVSEIASDIAVPNLQHFSMMFKKHTGLSPTQYRKINREVIYKQIDLSTA